MNFVDVVKSGRPFRRPFWQSWSTPGGGAQLFFGDDILADDWEVQEPEVTVTRTQFWEAANEVLPPIPGNDWNCAIQDNFKRLARYLGLEGTP